MRFRTAILAAAVCLAPSASAQVPTAPAAPPGGRHPEAGGLLIRHYPPEVYNGGGQNWTMLQDARGVIYVGSTSALLEYDYVTAALLELSPATGKPTYVSAGHIHSLLLTHDGDVVRMGSTGAPLGLLPPGLPYDGTPVEIGPGDCLVLCSDGVPDAQNEAGEEFGEDRLSDIVYAARLEPAETIVTRVVEAIDHFAGAAPQFDDITLLVLRRLP